MNLEIKDLSVVYESNGRPLRAVDRVNLTIPPRSTLGLVGETGCGKSTIARAIVGMVPVASGALAVDGVDATAQAERESPDFRRRVQMIFQDPSASLNPRMRIGDAIGEALMSRSDLSRSAHASERARIFDLVGLPAVMLDRYPHQLSGGQRQRVAIARALAVGPELLICDEVTSALDVSVQATILNLLKTLQRDVGLSLLFISHDLSAVRYMSDAVAVMYLGRVVEFAATNHLFANSQHPYTSALVLSVPQIGSPRVAPLAGELPDPRNLPRGCPFQGRCPQGPVFRPERTLCIDADPALGAAGKMNHAACHFADPAAVAAAPLLVSLR